MNNTGHMSVKHNARTLDDAISLSKKKNECSHCSENYRCCASK